MIRFGTRLTWALGVALRLATSVVAEEPPSSVWSPPASPEVRVASAEPTPAVGELPAPEDGAAEDEETVLGGPWLLGDAAIEEGEAESDWYQPNYWFGITPWDTGIELGLNGSAGNNEAFSVRTGGYMKRESRFSKLDYSIYYNRTTTAGLTTQNNATSDIRNDWMLDDTSPWTLYAKANVFYDEFQAFDIQTNGNSGIGYQIFKDPVVNLTTRAGAGASREFGGPENEWTPEALLGFEYEQNVSDTQKFFANFEYYPALEGFADYRIVTDGGWEIELSQPSNMSLKISASDRYDSTSFGAEPNLLNYSVLLLLKL
jgi:putative salt-induced outer membrane protein YdiY